MVFTIHARLNKKEKKAIIKEVREAQQQKVVSFNDPVSDNLRVGWNQLTTDHFYRLQCDLKHIGNIPIMDSLRGDSLDNDDPCTKEYFSHYKDYDLDNISDGIRRAEAGLQYLQRLIDQENEKRRKPGRKSTGT